jgi:8-oxo-dGTP pyrophosphatase MutT (NUDIX family)
MEHTILYRTPRFDVCSAPVHTATESDRRFYYVDKPDAVAVVALAGGAVLLLRVTRPLAPESCYELPGGRIERGERPEEAAARELQEEAAVTFTSLRLLGRIHALPSVINETIHVFGGLIAGPRPERLTTQAVAEGIEELRFFAMDDIRRMMASGDIGVSADIHALVIAWEWLEQSAIAT